MLAITGSKVTGSLYLLPKPYPKEEKRYDGASSVGVAHEENL